MLWSLNRSKKKVKIEWLFNAKGVIWRLLPTANGYFVGEDRTMDDKKTSFFCIDQKTGEVFWKDISFSEAWWISIEVIHDNVVFLHEYATPDMPEHKKIIAVSLLTGELLWSNDTMKFEFALGGHVYASRETYDTRIFSELDLQSGSLIRDLDEGSIDVLRNGAEPFSDPQIEFPMTFDLETDVDSDPTGILQKNTTRFQATRQVEYLMKNDMVIIAYYNKIGGNSHEQLLQQNLVIVEKEKSDILYKDTMCDQANVFAPDLFFAKKDFLYYIKDKRTLQAIKLSATKD